MTELVQEANAASNNNVVFIDNQLEKTDEVLVTNEDTERIYDVRGFLGFFAQLNNDVSGVSIDITISKTTIHFDDVSDLVSSDFQTEVALETVVAGALSTPFELVRATPMITAILLTFHRTTLNPPVVVHGVVSAN